MAIYHVTDNWDGNDLRSIVMQIDDGDMELNDALQMLANKWFDGDTDKADDYLFRLSDGREVHCYATLSEAIEHRDLYSPSGQILEIMTADEDGDLLRVQTGDEFPHPVVFGRIPAELVSVVALV